MPPDATTGEAFTEPAPRSCSPPQAAQSAPPSPSSPLAPAAAPPAPQLPHKRAPAPNAIKARHSVKRTPQHHRTQSIGRAAALSTSSTARKFCLSRSKSSEVIVRSAIASVKRNNKSFTKLTSLHATKTSAPPGRAGLQPLTETAPPGSVTSAANTQPLTHTALCEDPARELLLNAPQKTGPARSKSEVSIKSTKFNSLLMLTHVPQGGLKSSARRGRAILGLNEDPDHNYEDVSDNLEAEEHVPLPHVGSPGLRVRAPTGSDVRSSSAYARPSPPPVLADDRADSSSDDLALRNLYGGSFLLSQSTGMTHKVDPGAELMTSYANVSRTASRSTSKTLDHSGDMVFMSAAPRDADVDVDRPGRTRNASPTSQLQMSVLRPAPRPEASETSAAKSRLSLGPQLSNKNFAGYLDSSTPGNAGLETRTQQRLWLQRESSLMDVSANLDPDRMTSLSDLSLNKLMFAHNMSSANLRDKYMTRLLSNGNLDAAGAEPSLVTSEPGGSLSSFMNILQNMHQNSIQSRTEFERLNREYVNVRRHLNPVAASLGRIEKYLLQIDDGSLRSGAGTLDRDAYAETDASSPSDGASELYKAQKISELWQDALQTSSASSVLLKKYQDDQLQQGGRSSVEEARGRGSGSASCMVLLFRLRGR